MSTNKRTPILPEICPDCGSDDLHLKTNGRHVVSAQCQDCRYYWLLTTGYPLRVANAAPDLLQAAQNLLAYLPESGDPFQDKLEAALVAAIVKAEGNA